MNIFIKLSSVFLLSLAFFVAVSVFAAEIRLDAHRLEINSGEQLLVDIVIHSEESLNAIEGRLVFPADKLLVKEIRDGNSVINFWVEKPRIEASGVILFSGITPGGFSGTNNGIFSVVFEAKNTGVASVTLQNIKALKNDGLGTELVLSTRDTAVSIKSGDSNARKETLTDTELPEDFNPTVESDPNIFDGKYFLVFATQDKASGIDRYEIKEGRQKIMTFFSRWGVAESPYVLRDQKLRSFIFVKAVDRAGNMRIEKISPQNLLSWYENYENWIIIIAVVLVVLLATKKLWRKKRI